MDKPTFPKTTGPWTVRSCEARYDNPWLRVEHNDVIHPDGHDGIYGVVRFKNVAVGVLPVFEDGTVPLVGQYRFPLQAYSWELPEGGGPAGEDDLETARRELAEETGLVAKYWLPLIEFDVSNSVTDERSACFLAWDLTPGTTAPESSEELAHDRIAFSDLVARCLDGRIRDSLTLVMTLAAKAKAERGELPERIAARLLA
ncbi:MAG: NUDIX hydrolase [Hyphomonadaceae bacterium]|nr:NUDIX hydrolase [Hyphomonadaceae bacterium]